MYPSDIIISQLSPIRFVSRIPPRALAILREMAAVAGWLPAGWYVVDQPGVYSSSCEGLWILYIFFIASTCVTRPGPCTKSHSINRFENSVSIMIMFVLLLPAI
jgi:hypothetical protein